MTPNGEDGIRRVTPDAFDGLRASEMAEAAIQSMTEGRPVRL